MSHIEKNQDKINTTYYYAHWSYCSSDVLSWKIL